jgi:hypothetical protein
LRDDRLPKILPFFLGLIIFEGIFGEADMTLFLTAFGRVLDPLI